MVRVGGIPEWCLPTRAMCMMAFALRIERRMGVAALMDPLGGEFHV